MEQNTRAQFDMIESGAGAFEITVNGKLLYSKKATGRFPTDDELDALIPS